MNKVLKISALAFIVLCVACTPKEKTASDYFAQAENLFLAGQDSLAQVTLDSIHTLFPKEVGMRRKADTLQWRIDLKLAKILLPQIETELAQYSDTLPYLTKDFVYIKDEKYQDIGSFEHKLLKTERNTSRTYLKPTTNEHGVFSLTATYVGGKARHNAIRVEVEDASITSQALDYEDVYSFDDNGLLHEIMQFSDDQLNGIEQFICNNSDKRIKIIYDGTDGPYTFYLTDREKVAFAETYILSGVLNKIYTLTNNQLITAQKIELLNQRLR